MVAHEPGAEVVGPVELVGLVEKLAVLAEGASACSELKLELLAECGGQVQPEPE